MTKYKTIEDLETHKKSTHGLENVKDESKTTGENEVKGKKKKMKKSLNLKSVVAVECVECDELFRSEEDLETHKKKTHLDRSGPMFQSGRLFCIHYSLSLAFAILLVKLL